MRPMSQKPKVVLELAEALEEVGDGGEAFTHKEHVTSDPVSPPKA